jgi:hypothetical protein
MAASEYEKNGTASTPASSEMGDGRLFVGIEEVYLRIVGVPGQLSFCAA